MTSNEQWLEQEIPNHLRLKDTIRSILENMLISREIDYLSVSGRVKDKKSALEKIKQKGYSNPKAQLTDLTGIRVIVFLENDVKKTSDIIKECFNVDLENSLDKSQALAPDQIGYRSVHFVCDIGDSRSKLPEFSGLAEMKFEIQVRTVLQHAWAELSHDRNYKFRGQLPAEIEREMFLYAGMLEIADKGFEQIAKRIDDYANQINDKFTASDYKFTLDSISLPKVVKQWAKDNSVTLDEPSHLANTDYSDLLKELHTLDIITAEDLLKIIPNNFPEVLASNKLSSTIFGYVRDWMVIHDWQKLIASGLVSWTLIDDEDTEIIQHFVNENELIDIKNNFSLEQLF